MLQDPTGSLNPRHTVYEAVAEGLRVHRIGGDEQTRVADALSRVGLRPAERYFLRYPHELSGGQRQRVVIAGALVLDPEVLVADEPVSSLDASVRGEILALLLGAAPRSSGLSVLVVTHDLGLAWNIADRIAVMYLGRIVESGPTEQVLADPQHPYTRALLSVVPETKHLEPIVLAGEPPDPTRVPAGCRFHPRCPALASGAAERGRGRRRLPTNAAFRCSPRRRPTSPACFLLRTSGRAHWTEASVTDSRISRRSGRCSGGRSRGRCRRRCRRRTTSTRRTGVASASRCCTRVVLRRPAARPASATGPGGSPSLDVAGESVLVTRDGEGGFRAFYNVCRHRGSQVVPGRPRRSSRPHRAAAQSLRCPYHSWTYDLDGRLLRAPHTEDVDDFDPDGFGLHPVGVDTWGGFLFLHLTPQAGAACVARFARRGRRASGALPARAPRRRRQSLTYDVRANYKVVLENYNECYHCAGVHPELVRLVPAFGRGGADLDWEDGIPHRDGAWTFTASGTSDRAPFAGLDDARAGAAQGRAALPEPDAQPVRRPRGGVHALADGARPDPHRVRPAVRAGRGRARHGFDPSDAADFWDVVNRRTGRSASRCSAACRRAAYTQGWFAPMEDASLDIRRWLLPRLGEAAP